MTGRSGLVSVIMPLYNAERYVGEAIESVLSQTYSHLELIIVDDGSSDRSLAIARDYAAQDQRIKIVCNPLNYGVAKTRNLAIREARGEYVACLDNDDVALPSRLEEQVRFLQTCADYAFVASDLEIIDEQSRTVGWRTYPHTDEEIRRSMLRVNPVANPACMYRRAVFDELGGAYDESVCPVEDYDLVLRMARNYKLANLDQKLTKYRISTTQVKSRYLKKTIKKTLLIQYNAIRQGLPDNALNKLYRIGLMMLLLLPNRLVLSLFKRLYYATPAKA